MRITLKNLGRLEEAAIDLSRDLIVLTGPNNTSKTYVAYAIYGFCSNIREDLFPASNSVVPPMNDTATSSSFDLAAIVRAQIDEILEKLDTIERMRLSDVLGGTRYLYRSLRGYCSARSERN